MTNVLTLIIAVVMIAAGGVLGYGLGHLAGYEAGKRDGEAIVAASLKKQGDTIAAEAEAAREAALAPGAAARLLKEWCRDCTP